MTQGLSSGPRPKDLGGIKLKRTAIRTLLTVIGLTAMVAAISCGGGSDSGGKTPAPAGSTATSAPLKPYAIGFSADLSGSLSFYGKPLLGGLKAAVQAINDAGGVNGHQIKLTALDDKSDVPTALANFQQLTSSGALAIVGQTHSAVTAALAPEAAKAKVPMFTSTALPFTPYVYGGELSSTQNAIVEMNFIKQLAAGKSGVRIAFLSPESPFGHDFLTQAQKMIDANGWKLVETQWMSPTATDVSAQAAALAAAKPDYIISHGTDNLNPMVLQALSDRGVKAPYVSTFSTSSDPTFQKIANPDYYAIRSYAWPLDGNIPQTAVMKAAAVKAGTDGDMTSNYFTQGWVTGQLLAQALKSCGDSCTSDQLNTALEAVSSFDTVGLSAPISLSKTNHALITATKVYHWDATAKKTVAVGDYVPAPTQ